MMERYDFSTRGGFVYVVVRDGRRTSSEIKGVYSAKWLAESRIKRVPEDYRSNWYWLKRKIR